MKENKTVIECEKFNIELSNSGNDSSWISVVNKDGGTSKQPYGSLTKDQLKALKNAINEELRRITKNEP